MSKLTNAGTFSQDVIYAKLYERLLTQSIQTILRKIPSVIESKENWTNALKEYMRVGVKSGQTYTPNANLALADFNPTMEVIESDVYRLESKLLYSRKYPYADLTNAFLKPKTRDLLIAKRRDMVLKSYKLDLLKAELPWLLGKSGVAIGGKTLDQIVYDKEVNTYGKTPIESLNMLRDEIAGLKIPSNKHTKFGSKAGKESFVYSGDASNLKVIANSIWKNDVADKLATLFNKNEVLTKIEMVDYDFSKAEGMTKAETDKIKFILLDKSAIVKGVKLEIVSTTFIMEFLLERNIFWFGYARLPQYPIILFKDTPPSKK